MLACAAGAAERMVKRGGAQLRMHARMEVTRITGRCVQPYLQHPPWASEIRMSRCHGLD